MLRIQLLAFAVRWPRSRTTIPALGLAVILGSGLAWPSASGRESEPKALLREDLERKIEALIQASAYRDGLWGFLVADTKTGEALLERNPDRLFAPASVTKLFSAAAALVELGPNHRFQTPVVRRGAVDEQGTLAGDLILIAQGDPCLGGRTGTDGSLMFVDDDHTYATGNPRSDILPIDPLAGLDHLAREIEASGIRKVTGDVIVDDRLFERAESTGSGPHRVSPIVINDNLIDLLVQPAKSVGDPALVSFIPSTQFLSMDALVETAPEGEEARIEIQEISPRRITVRGQVPLGHQRILAIHEIADPASFARTLFIESLRRRGVRVLASPLGANSTSSLPPLKQVSQFPKVAEYTSPPFRDFVRVILKVSHNLHASMLPLLIAVRHGESTLSEGLRRQAEILRGLGVDSDRISLGGGAGGSRADLVSPRGTVALLRAMSQRPEGVAFDSALPILGRDGTLVRAVSPESPARGHVHAKTGTYWVDNGLSGKAVLTSKALAGYLETAGGRQLVFAVFVNNVPLDAPAPGRSISEATAEAGRLLARFCELIYESDQEAALVPAGGGSSTGGTASKPAGSESEP
jgi:D-alanyl-D-alanine carboxypeptidase/D-alanyl-D-alanine-endopeptidase (penicillin-binding protein 4)